MELDIQEVKQPVQKVYKVEVPQDLSLYKNDRSRATITTTDLGEKGMEVKLTIPYSISSSVTGDDGQAVAGLGRLVFLKDLIQLAITKYNDHAESRGKV